MVNNFENVKKGFEKEMGLKFEDNKDQFLQYYQAKMLDGIFNQQTKLELVIQKLNWINDSLQAMNKNKNQING